MPVETTIWKISNTVEKVSFVALELESKLQSALEENLEILDSRLLLLGRQVRTDFNKLIDLLAIDDVGHLHIIELKKGLTPREVVAQGLDYASWVSGLDRDRIEKIYSEQKNGKTFTEAFQEHFDAPTPETLNEEHHITIVAAQIDAATERIVQYLAAFTVPINVVSFQHFKVNGEEFLVRSWLIDPEEVEAGQPVSKKKAPWNGRDFYVTFKEEAWRNWEDAVKYGFLSAGKGRKYSRMLERLQPGHYVCAYIPKTGYLGVGEVTSSAVPIKDFPFTENGQVVAAPQLPFKATDALHDFNDPELSEWLVGVNWLQVVPREQALSGPDLFSNPYIACRLTDQGTLDALTKRFPQAFQDESSSLSV